VLEDGVDTPKTAAGEDGRLFKWRCHDARGCQQTKDQADAGAAHNSMDPPDEAAPRWQVIRREVCLTQLAIS